MSNTKSREVIWGDRISAAKINAESARQRANEALLSERLLRSNELTKMMEPKFKNDPICSTMARTQKLSLIGTVGSMSASPRITDIAHHKRHVRFVPILLQKSKIDQPQKSGES